jgi:hypothetical protein
MRRRAVYLSWCICLAFVALARAQAPADIVFKDDVKRHVIKGDDEEDFDVAVTLTADAVVLARKGGKAASEATSIPYKSISSITYDRRSKVRKMAYTMSPAKKHFLTIQFKAGDVGDFAELEMSKDVAPKLTATLEARSGVKIDRTGS